MNRERAKARVFELLDERNPQPVEMTSEGIQNLSIELVHSIVDAIADELEAEAAAPQLSPAAQCRLRRVAEAAECENHSFEENASDPKGRKGYDY